MGDFHQVGNDYYYSDEHEEMEEGDIQGEEWVKKGNRWVMGPNMAPMEGERGGEDVVPEPHHSRPRWANFVHNLIE